MKLWNTVDTAIARLATVARREEGQTMVEYGLIIVLVAVALVTILTTLGTDVGNVFTKIGTDLESAI